MGEAGKAPWGRHVCSKLCCEYAAPTGLGGGLQTCCYKYAAPTGLGRPSPKSVIIRKILILTNFADIVISCTKSTGKGDKKRNLPSSSYPFSL
ncbi:Uncharacterized protein dnm_035990 [Desulfonema magnum]|uniref:Uncharacterized protein n=1 Tax=Desulfonema magnum TaxID=45655 RepID=A0A975BM48_9BACT|nr:Uncharacterized protein dnm_035990 [Desulfonema magnum]